MLTPIDLSTYILHSPCLQSPMSLSFQAPEQPSKLLATARVFWYSYLRLLGYLHKMDNQVHCLSLCLVGGFPHTTDFQYHLCEEPNQQPMFGLTHTLD